MTIFEEHQGDILSTENESIKWQNKHIDVKYHFLHNYVAAGRIVLEYCPDEHLVVDTWTKPLDQNKFQSHLISMGVSYK